MTKATAATTATTTTTVEICSLKQLEIKLHPDIRQHLSIQYKNDFEMVLQAMKRPPATTICRVNYIKSTKQEVVDGLRNAIIDIPYLEVIDNVSGFDDVVCIRPKVENNATTSTAPPLYDSQIPLNGDVIFSNWPERKAKGWPMTNKAVICDRFCGEAVLRGSDIFVRGILAADAGIQEGDIVAVYADIRDSASLAVPRGLVLDHYTGKCVFLGMGTMQCSRSDIFRLTQGIAVSMSRNPIDRVGPCLPPLSGVLQDKMMLQNLPSVVVGHALNPQPNEVILDMCAAPGGKSAHLASLVKNQATIVSCDKSRKKMVSAKELFQRIGATCIVPLALDSTDCVETNVATNEQFKSVKEIIESASVSEKYGLKQVKRFFPESFDRILLDPPCSALGLRPKLFVVQEDLHSVLKHGVYQEKFIPQAVALLKKGGTMTYSTCTINSSENEAMVRHILDNHQDLELIPLECNLGKAGLPGYGLNDEERSKVRRFDPHDESDTMGFFVALFRKKISNSLF